MPIKCIIELVSHKTMYTEITLQLYFIKEDCQRLMTVLTALEEKETPLASIIWQSQDVSYLKMYLRAGCEKASFGTETDRLLSKLPEPD